MHSVAEEERSAYVFDLLQCRNVRLDHGDECGDLWIN